MTVHYVLPALFFLLSLNPGGCLLELSIGGRMYSFFFLNCAMPANMKSPTVGYLADTSFALRPFDKLIASHKIVHYFSSIVFSLYHHWPSRTFTWILYRLAHKFVIIIVRLLPTWNDRWWMLPKTPFALFSLNRLFEPRHDRANMSCVSVIMLLASFIYCAQCKWCIRAQPNPPSAMIELASAVQLIKRCRRILTSNSNRQPPGPMATWRQRNRQETVCGLMRLK